MVSKRPVISEVIRLATPTAIIRERVPLIIKKVNTWNHPGILGCLFFQETCPKIRERV